MSIPEPNDSSTLEHWSFLLLLAGVSVLFVWVTWPFIGPVMWAALAAIMFQPLYKWMLKRMRGKRNISATLTLVIIFFAVLLPALLIGTLVVEEAVSIVNRVSADPIDLGAIYTSIFNWLPGWAQELAANNGWRDVDAMQLRVQDFLRQSAGVIAQQAFSIGSGALVFLLNFSIFLYVLFFLLRDGSRIGETILHSAPLERGIANRLGDRFLGVVRAVVKGSVVVGVVQGALGGGLLAIAGIPSPLLLAVLMAIFALIPAIGTALVWAPAGLWLLFTGEVGMGIFVLAGGSIVIASVDNILRPLLVGRDTGIPDWIILITTLGGIALAGFSGIVLGPLVAGLFLASWSILQEHRDEDEEAEERYRLKVGPDGKAKGAGNPDADPFGTASEPGEA